MTAPKLRARVAGEIRRGYGKFWQIGDRPVLARHRRAVLVAARGTLDKDYNNELLRREVERLAASDIAERAWAAAGALDGVLPELPQLPPVLAGLAARVIMSGLCRDGGPSPIRAAA